MRESLLNDFEVMSRTRAVAEAQAKGVKEVGLDYTFDRCQASCGRAGHGLPGSRDRGQTGRHSFV
jgi:hypothetical protein